MQTKYLLRAFTLLIIPVLFYFLISGFNNSTIESSAVPPQRLTVSVAKDFVNYILNTDYFYYPRNDMMENFMDKYRGELNFNGVQLYDADSGTSHLGFFDLSLSGAQISNVNSLITNAHNNNLKAIYERSNISNLCYAQRLVYEIASGSGHTDVNDGFCYQTISGIYEVESDGTTAIHACTGNCGVGNNAASAGYIAQNIYENLQHTDLPDFSRQTRDAWEWKLKPRLKIKQSDFSLNDSRPVVTIYAYSFDGTLIASNTIRVNNFRNSSNTYDGEYKDIFTFSGPNDSLWVPGDKTNGLNKGRDDNWSEWPANCHVDFKIYWHGNVDVWFDKLTVDDYRANKMFSPAPNNYDPFMQQELDNFAGSGKNDVFFVDETVYSNIPCIKYVTDYLRANSPGTLICCATTNYLNVHGLKNDALGYRPFLQAVHPDYFQADAQNFFGWRDANTGNYHNSYYPDNITPSDVLVPAGSAPSGWKASKTTYNEWLQNDVFGDKTSHSIEPGTFIYQVRLARDNANTYSPGTRMIMQPQVQGLLYNYNDNNGLYDDGLREPLDEEYSAQAMLSIAHGADGLSWFWFQSAVGSESNEEVKPYFPHLKNISVPNHNYTYGLINPDATKRTINMWGQNKWADIASVNAKILSWKPSLDAVTWLNGYSVHSENANHNFISDILSIDPSKSGYNPTCYLSSPGYWADCNDQRFWEMGFFSTTEANTKYIMMVNRRCIPATTSPAYDGDNRVLKIKFNPTQLTPAVNWKITEVGNPDNPGVIFSRNNTGFIDIGSTTSGMGYFKPGEGKLFKLFPVIQSGGTFTDSDTLNGSNITCSDTINTNGYNLTITGNSTLSMSDSAAIIMNGGTLTIGSASSGPTSSKNTFQNTGTGHKWGGIQCTNGNVKIYNASFQNINSPAPVYSINCINCPVVDIRYNTFIASDTSNGGINIAYTGTTGFVPPAAYINYNTFTMNDSRYNAIQVQGFAGLTSGLYAENNTMSSNGNATGIFLSTITGGVIKNNSISGFSNGINMLFSTADIYGNTISNTASSSKGILASSHSSMNLAPNGAEWTGGLNYITNTYGNSHNIDLTNSVFTINGGDNTFNISSTGSPYHLYGSLWNGSYSTKQKNNCYKLSGTAITLPTLPNNSITDSSGNGVTFTLSPYSCGVTPPAGTDIVDIGNGLYDTIPNGSGIGGGESSVTTISSISDSINVQMRHKNYNVVKTLCHTLIDNNPDSMESIASLQTLYMAVSLTDTTTAGKTALKTYYENLILNHGNNPAIVDISNYLIQKCKVLLRQYSSAMAGFTQIISNNQYNYEGLLARWDYMAASLLMNGGGGGEIIINNDELGITKEYNKSEEFDNFNNLDGDKSPFTKEQKATINNSISTVTKTKRESEEAKIIELKVKSDKGDDNAKNELNKKMALKNTIKTEKPKSIYEHLRIVSGDIQKVFGKPDVKNTNTVNLVPTVFMLHQNYPNPFNPSATIKYDLPKDVKVQIKIYDILGREVITLVNEFKKAGFYQAVFDGTNLASGVYFYKIEAGEYIDSKKMVLVK